MIYKTSRSVTQSCGTRGASRATGAHDGIDHSKTRYRLESMSKLSELLFSDRMSPSQRRAKELAKADYRLLIGLVGVRKARGMTQKDVADKLGVSQPTIADFERQDADPKLSTIRRYAHAVGAIVTHQVEVDNGQYDHVADWSARTYRFEQTLSYSAPASQKADFALAA
ncbi:helix-turn-helix domain-containing protein [Leifsonia sp. NPDC056824]|uniref:helix-turn-helix domain-containing protein n=1 Tax=Leifsonia sp. NPDC056824 TaxID=3345953 RepID=UPI0036B8F084